MTSALQLLYILKPPRRNQESIAAIESDHPDPDPDDVRRRRRDRRHGRRGEDGDQSQRSHGEASKGRQRRSRGSRMEHELGRSSRNGSDGYWPGNSSHGGVSISMLTRLGLARNDHLPGAVEEARKRLLERLRSVSLTDNRQRAPNDLVPDNAHLSSNSNILSSEAAISNKKKVAALCWDAFCTMKGETFRSSDEKFEAGFMTELTECCICLEGFKDGDWLINLCCSHKFHPACLEPWVQSSGDCPLCRADIIL